MPRPQVIVSRFGVPIPGQNEAALEFTPPPLEVAAWLSSAEELDAVEGNVVTSIPRYTDIHWNGSIMSAIEYLKSLDIEPDERFHVIRASSRRELL